MPPEAVAMQFISAQETGITLALAANPGAAIVFTGGASSGTGTAIFLDYPLGSVAPTFNISGSVSFVSASTSTSSVFWNTMNPAYWSTLNVAAGGALTLNAGVSSMNNGLSVASSGASVTIAGSGTGTMTGARWRSPPAR